MYFDILIHIQLFFQVHLCETDSSILTLTSNTKSSSEYKDQSSPTSFHNQDVPEHNNDRILRKASTSSSSGSSKGSTGLKGQGRGITFNSLKDSENTFNSTNESVVVVVRSLWRDASEEERYAMFCNIVFKTRTNGNIANHKSNYLYHKDY